MERMAKIMIVERIRKNEMVYPTSSLVLPYAG